MALPLDEARPLVLAEAERLIREMRREGGTVAPEPTAGELARVERLA